MNTPIHIAEASMTQHPQHPQSSLRSRLLQRVQASQAFESQFQTVRRDAAWSSVTAAVRSKPLARTAVARSCLVELQPGGTLPQDAEFTQAELVLLSGQARVAGQTLACGEAACMPHDAAHTVRACGDGARLYLRLSAPDAPATGLAHFSCLGDDTSWDDFCPGVRIKALWQGGERSSMLVRMQAGASVNAHGHPLEEECMMLAGEAFVGDTLLRSNEYQLAPMGSRHGAVMTDVGALFYVHGSLDPAAYL
jgi:quercetin dioxygenase-like cupin family protein